VTRRGRVEAARPEKDGQGRLHIPQYRDCRNPGHPALHMSREPTRFLRAHGVHVPRVGRAVVHRCQPDVGRGSCQVGSPSAKPKTNATTSQGTVSVVPTGRPPVDRSPPTVRVL
jgi:hypothetical protein